MANLIITHMEVYQSAGITLKVPPFENVDILLLNILHYVIPSAGTLISKKEPDSINLKRNTEFAEF